MASDESNPFERLPLIRDAGSNVTKQVVILPGQEKCAR